MISRIFERAAVVGAVIVLTGVMASSQEAPGGRVFLFGVLVKTQALRNQVVADIQNLDREIAENDRAARKAGEIMTTAKARGNAQAETIARDALENSRQAKQKNENTRARLETARLRADTSIATVKSLLASAASFGPDSRVRGIVSHYSGRAEIFGKDGKKADLDGRAAGLLEPGDEIRTSSGGSVELQMLDGRAAIQLGESSRLRLEEDTPREQTLRLLQGKIYSTVDKLDDFRGAIERGLTDYASDVRTAGDSLAGDVGKIRKSLVQWSNRKIAIRTPTAVCGVRGTKFSVEVKEDGTTELAVLEGAVEAGSASGGQATLVEAGSRVLVTASGVSAPQKSAATNAWWEK